MSQPVLYVAASILLAFVTFVMGGQRGCKVGYMKALEDMETVTKNKLKNR